MQIQLENLLQVEFLSFREARMTHNFENLTLEHLGSAIFNEIHRLESQFENLVRYDDVFVKKLKDAELQNMGQKTKIEVCVLIDKNKIVGILANYHYNIIFM